MHGLLFSHRKGKAEGSWTGTISKDSRQWEKERDGMGNRNGGSRGAGMRKKLFGNNWKRDRGRRENGEKSRGKLVT